MRWLAYRGIVKEEAPEMIFFLFEVRESEEGDVCLSVGLKGRGGKGKG